MPTAPDLDIINASLTDSTLSAGDQIEANWDVRNIGDAAIGSGNVSLLIFDVSANDYVRNSGGSPRVFDTNTINSLAAGATDINESDRFNLPSDLSPGSYQLVLAATPPSGVTEADLSNNIERLNFTVEDNTAPDLDIINASLTDSTLSAGDQIEANWDVRNIGDAAIGSGNVSLLIFDVSANDYVRNSGGSPRVFDTNTINSLAAGATDTNATLSFALPTDLDAGSYQLVLAATPPSGVAEYSYANNTERLDFTVEGIPETFFVPNFDTNPNDDDQDIDALLSPQGYLIDSTRTIKFDFAESIADVTFSDSPILLADGTVASDLTYNEAVIFDSTLNEQQREGVRDALESFSDFVDLQFVEGARSGNNPFLEFSNSHLLGSEGRAFAITPNETDATGTVGFDESRSHLWGVGTKASFTNLHEIGHALGLLHGHETDFGGAMTAEHNSHEYSIMTYSSYIGDVTPGTSIAEGNYAQSLMMYDIAALQRLYGANYTAQSGDTIYTFDVDSGEMKANGIPQGVPHSNVIFRTIWDGNGVDTYDLSNYTRDLKISLVAGDFSDFDVNGNNQRARLDRNLDEFASGHVYNALQVNGDSRSLIENAKGGSGNDTIFGNGLANEITGGVGNDKLYDGAGADTVYGGADNDYIRVGGGEDYFDGGSGTDYISYYSSSNGVTLDLLNNTASRSWAVNDTILNFEGASGSKTGHDEIYGTNGNNTIKTYGGDDLIEGRSGNDKLYDGSGADTVYGGSGNDYIRVGGGKDYFDGGSGSDYISYYSSSNGVTLDLLKNTASRSWAANDTILNFESASGSKTGHDKLYGTQGDNTFKSYGGNDKLYGRGGDDKLYGGDGKDRFDGGAGTDLLFGGADADIFHFDFGEDHDVIKDFENNLDTIELDNFAFSENQDAFDFASQVGSSVVFDFGGGDMLTVENATIGQLYNDLEIV